MYIVYSKVSILFQLHYISTKNVIIFETEMELDKHSLMSESQRLSIWLIHTLLSPLHACLLHCGKYC